MSGALLELLSQAHDLQRLADERMCRTLHGPPLTPADDAAYWRSRLALAMRARIVFGAEAQR